MKLEVFHLLGAVVVGLGFVKIGSAEYTDASESASAKFRRALERRLSPHANISTPESENFENAAMRWSPFGAPNVTTVVQVANTHDVANTVKLANQYGIPFLATNHRHGVSTVMQNLQGGVQIDVSGLQTIQLSKTRQDAVTLGGGVYTTEVIDYLFQHGRMSASGSCGCVGLVGAALGGGIGKTQGQFGLMLDNILDATVVLANGDIVVASEKSHSDLFWGLRGAGHNFGVVTELTYRTHELFPADGHWYIATLGFANDKLEDVIEIYQRFTGPGSDVGLTLTLQLAFNPELSETEPTLRLLINFAGSEQQAARYADPFIDLADVKVINSSVPYYLVASASGSDVDNLPCQNSLLRHPGIPIQLNGTDIPTLRAISDTFRDAVAAYPGLQGGFALESYGWQAVQSVPAESTAYPWRGDYIYAFWAGSYEDASLDEPAIELGEEIRRLLLNGSGQSEVHAYVNYALGTETFGELYGHEEWRQERLSALKQKYDPKGVFSYYHPIPLSSGQT
ncbi:hypothetical protein BGZ61DRAFT_420295 [Ilyonectria robusta]|uniref:uncharacterized protein n=1 Tax=Ilyonectria robusta TaxID=1079257 RepID=UPI001E8ED5A4|nr:uncharacterized protein BGZ61DRAFT_420295 [Ilyonectria robusta]KAH8694402.1 hypothetical protein BGZ61DRAFT_420295 [Ilyonectria robusta]